MRDTKLYCCPEYGWKAYINAPILREQYNCCSKTLFIAQFKEQGTNTELYSTMKTGANYTLLSRTYTLAPSTKLIDGAEKFGNYK